MARVRRYASEAAVSQANEAAASMAAFVGPLTPKKKKSSTKKDRRSIERTTAEVSRMIASKDWAGVDVDHLIALYALLYERVYGVEPLDLNPETWWFARTSAQKLVKDEFGGEPVRAAAFLQWVWGREAGKEEWRRQNNRQGGRISWHVQFARRDILAEFRLAQARRRST